MRAIFYFLLLTNLAVLGAQVYLTAPAIADVNDGVVKTSIPSIRMVSEPAKLTTQIPATVESFPVADMDDREMCTLIGPFTELLMAEYARDEANQKGAKAFIGELKSKQQEVYELRITVSGDKQEIIKAISELQANEFEPFVVRDAAEGPYLLVAQGNFKPELERQLGVVSELGFVAKIVENSVFIAENWLIFRNAYLSDTVLSVVNGVLVENNSLEKRQNFCLGVANRQKFL